MHTYTNEIIDELNLQHLPESQQRRFLDQCTELVLKRVWLRVLREVSTLDEEERRGFGPMNGRSIEERMNILSARVPHIPQWVGEEARALQKELVSAIV